MTITAKSNDATLARAAAKGDSTAFDLLIERYFGMVHAIAFARLRDREATEEVAQEVFLRVYLHLDRFDPKRSFSTWLTTIARNLAIDWARRGQRASRLIPTLPLDDIADCLADSDKGARERMSDDQESRALLEAIDALEDDERELVLLRYVEELRPTEIARRLGIHRKTVQRRLDKALVTLRGSLEPILRETAPSLRPSSRSVARTTAIIAATTTLSAASKSALAASATIGSLSATTAGVATTASIGMVKALSLVAVSLLVVGGATVALMKGGSPLRAPFENPDDDELAIEPWSGARLPADGPPAFAADGTTLPIHLVKIVPSPSAAPSYVLLNSGSFDAHGATVSDMAAKLKGVTAQWISAPDPLPSGRFDVSLFTPAKQRAYTTDTVIAALERNFSLSITREKQTRDVYVLSNPSGGAPPVFRKGRSGPATLETKGIPPRTTFNNTTMAVLHNKVQTTTHLPVVDETGLKGYEFDFTLQRPLLGEVTVPFITEAIRDQFGFELKKETREIEMVVIERAKAPATPTASSTTGTTLPIHLVKFGAAKVGVGRNSRWSKGTFYGNRHSVEDLIDCAYAIPATRRIIVDPLPKGRHSAAITMPKGQEALLRPTLQEALKLRFGLSMRIEKRMTNVYVLTNPTGATAHRRMPAGSLASTIESAIGKPVINEIKIKGKFDFDYHPPAFGKTKPKNVATALDDQFGFELKPARRAIDVLVVEKTTP